MTTTITIQREGTTIAHVTQTDVRNRMGYATAILRRAIEEHEGATADRAALFDASPEVHGSVTTWAHDTYYPVSSHVGAHAQTLRDPLPYTVIITEQP